MKGTEKFNFCDLIINKISFTLLSEITEEKEEKERERMRRENEEKKRRGGWEKMRGETNYPETKWGKEDISELGLRTVDVHEYED